ncbi:MAG TPA: phage GP46 family protein [Steroidobacteraceae bacterium]|nr:phage GP46 family protein [Steroidobacteraceae bacterium]
MSDIALIWGDSEADIALDGADLLIDEGLETAVTLSLFCDRRADASDALPESGASRRGWWGDEFADVEGHRTGSKLWLLWREKRSAELLEKARQYCDEALAWFIEDGIAATINIATSFASFADLFGDTEKANEYAIVIEVEMIKPDGTREAFRYAYLWAAQLAKRI